MFPSPQKKTHFRLGSKDDKLEGLRTGGDDYITKP